MTDLEVQLDVFSGPLDLLLHLIKKFEIDIYDIPISMITAQYMEYIHQMKDNQLTIAGEYIVMASTLMAIKSRMLIPKDTVDMEEVDDQYEDPRQELVDQLLLYQSIQEAADVLNQKQLQQAQIYTKATTDITQYKIDVKPLEPNAVAVEDLLMIMQHILVADQEETVIQADTLSIDQAIEYISSQLQEVQYLSFKHLVLANQKQDIVTLFLGLLELVKHQKVHCRQDKAYGPIQLSWNEDIKGDI